MIQDMRQGITAFYELTLRQLFLSSCFLHICGRLLNTDNRHGARASNDSSRVPWYICGV